MAKISEIHYPAERIASFKHVPARPQRRWSSVFWQFVRFGIVGVLNTGLDVLTLNLLVWYFPTHDANLLLLYNSLAYTFGAINSFVFNKYWTFGRKQKPTGRELMRFALVNIVGIVCNDALLWGSAKILHPLISNPFLWADAAKLVAVAGTMVISYFGMRLWVFAHVPHEQEKEKGWPGSEQSSLVTVGHLRREGGTSIKYSLSVILPAHNEEAVIAGTVFSVCKAAADWAEDFEVIVVNDGSQDRTQAILEEIAAKDPHVRIIHHKVNQGYGAALVSGFEAITKELAFFMDSDGQFDIRDLERFFPLIEEYDAVLGYRIDRQDTWMRKLNAWGWKALVSTVFKLRVRDIDCAFKLYRAKFFHEHRLETRGAMINTEILYKFARAGYTYTQVGVRHLPRRGGRATGAKPSVIARAFRELFLYARKWHREEREILDKNNRAS